MRAEIVPFSRPSLTRERARQIVAGKISATEFPIDPALGLDLETYRCGLCRGHFPPVGFAWGWYEHGIMVYAHRSCGREAENWAYDPALDDYPRGAA